MLTPHASPEPGEQDSAPLLRPAAPMTSIEQFESPDAAEAQFMADQRASGRRPAQPTEPASTPGDGDAGEPDAARAEAVGAGDGSADTVVAGAAAEPSPV